MRCRDTSPTGKLSPVLNLNYCTGSIQPARSDCSTGGKRGFPGITEWAQINSRNDLPIPKKVEYDEYYLNHRSFLFDLKILLLTFLKVIRAENVRH